MLVKGVIDKNNKVIKKYDPQVIRQVFSEKTASRVRKLLRGVVVEGSAPQADIPGLNKGSSEGQGLGLQFLRHIRRTEVLLFVLDGQRDDVEEQLAALMVELREFDPQMLKKPRLLMVNKIDLWDPETREEKKNQYAWADFLASAKSGEGTERILERLEKILFADAEENTESTFTKDQVKD